MNASDSGITAPDDMPVRKRKVVRDPSDPENAHAVAEAIERAPRMRRDEILLVNLSGRGDKDVETASRWFGLIEGELPQEGRA